MTVESGSGSSLSVTSTAVSVQELTATNFRLSLEIRSLRADLTQLKALRKYEDSKEVSRIKSAYEELENEVVELRKEKIRAGEQVKREGIFPIFSPAPSTPDSDVVTILKDQLKSEREKYKLLETKYEQLRRDFGSSNSVAYSELSTSAGSPLCYNREFSIEKFEDVNIKPQLEEMFKKPATRPRAVVPLAAEILPSTQPAVVASQVSVPPRPTVKRNPSDPSLQRLAKIAKYRGN